MKGRKWGKLPSVASFSYKQRLLRTCAEIRVYIDMRRGNVTPLFLDYFRASSSPFDSHGSPLLDYKLQLPLLLLLQWLLHRNACENPAIPNEIEARILSHALVGDGSRISGWEAWEKRRIDNASFFKYFTSIISFRRNKYDCIKCSQSCWVQRCISPLVEDCCVRFVWLKYQKSFSM